MARKATRRKRPLDAIPPTFEQTAHADYEEAPVTDKGQVVGRSYRKIRQLEALLKAKVIREEDAPYVHQYRHFADLVDRSPLKDSLNRTIRGAGEVADVPAAVVHAKQMIALCEAQAGALRDILRAVIVDDTSLREWAIWTHGAIDDCRIINGAKVCSIRPRQLAVDIARLEIMTACGFVRDALEGL